MALFKKRRGDRDEKTPADVKSKLSRGRERLQQVSAIRRQAIEFANGNHFVTISEDKSGVVPQSLVPARDGGDMPDHRVRRSHDLIGPIVKRKISASTQRVPGYEVNASSPDPEDWAAARVGEKVLLGGYDTWGVKRAIKKLVWNALVSEEGFIMATWDASVGPFVDVSELQEPEAEDEASPLEGALATEVGPEDVADDVVGEGDEEGEENPEDAEPEYVGMGEISLTVWGGLEVLWEPGVDFEKSRWYAIESARPVEDVEREEGFIKSDKGEKLRADADYGSPSAPKPKKAGSKMVMVTDYMERPCPEYPNGRRMVFANDRLIFPEENYPKVDHKGEVVDEPCIHRLAYSIDGSSDRDKGLVPSLVDAMRSYNLARNKEAEWIQVALVPQMTAPEGAISTPPSDEPGLVIEYDSTLTNGQEPKFRDVPPIPNELFTAQDRSKAELKEIALDNDAPAGVEAAKAFAAIYERDQLGWQDFISDLADVHGGIGRDCLTLVQLHYTENRMVAFRGRTGWENLDDFRGADLRGQTDVRIKPGSLEAITRAAVEAKISRINGMFPGYFPPPVVIAALNSARPERLIENFEQDEARAHLVISWIKSGKFFEIPPRPITPGEEAGPKLDPATGEPIMEDTGQMEPVMQEGVDPLTQEPAEEQIGVQPVMQPVMLEEVPGWMPRPFDNVDVHRAVFEGWMKTDDYEQLGEEGQRAAMVYYQALLDLETKAAQRKAELQSKMAEERGMENAAKTGQKAMPSGPSMGEGGEEADAAPQPA